MKIDPFTKIFLMVIAVLLFINLVNTFFSSKSALATSDNEARGRYQISAWGAQPQGGEARSGYYVLDTSTGAVVASKTEVHPAATGAGPKNW